MSHPIKSPRKLIEVALPLDAINEAAAREKSIRHGHPNMLHLWWARRPLAAARAVIFAQLVNDPGYQQGGGFKYGKNKREAAIERKRLFKIIEDLVQWENTTNEEVLEGARAEIRRSWREVCELNKDHPQAVELFNPDQLPALHDPFAGGGTIPLEAQRLGLKAYASDLNPVAVLINKAMIEIPPKFAGKPPVHPPDGSQLSTVNSQRAWPAATGLAEDVRYYGAWMRDEAQKRIGHIYPPIEVTKEMVKDQPELKPVIGQKLDVIAWLWSRTAKCPNPACGIDMPLLSSFVLSGKADRMIYLVPSIIAGRLEFGVSREPPSFDSDPKDGFKRGMSGIFQCAACGTITSRDYTAGFATNHGFGVAPTAVVCDGPHGRIYLPASPNRATERLPQVDLHDLEIELSANPRDVWCRNFGLNKPSELFTPRQLVMLTTFSDLVSEVRAKIHRDAQHAGMSDDGTGIDGGGITATSYSEAVSIYLSLAVDKLTDYNSNLVAWSPTRDQAKTTFARQALPMVWDFTEVNPFAGAAGDIAISIEGICRSVRTHQGFGFGLAAQCDAQSQTITTNMFVSTDPPYYDNIGYADLSDFFYVWLRRSLKTILPGLFNTMAVPKSEELVAVAYRHGSKAKAESFFLTGMTHAMHNLAIQAHPEAPITIYYAFKQAESVGNAGTSSTGWETFLNAVLCAGFQLTGTWPMRTERESRSVGIGTNALASSIILVCRQRSPLAPTISRREFLRELNAVLPEALDEMTKGSGEDRSPVAPVDLSQAIIGPGMAVFSKYAAVLEADGSPMSVRTALQLINRFLAEDDFDHDTQFCLHWFEQHGWNESVFGEADTLARAKGTSVDGVKEAGVIQSGGGKVRLLEWSEYPDDWDPRTDKRMPVWEALHHLIRAFRQGGDSASGALLAALGGKAEAVRQLAYRLYTLCERLGQAEDARAYNELITSWTGIESAAATAKPPEQGEFFNR